MPGLFGDEGEARAEVFLGHGKNKGQRAQADVMSGTAWPYPAELSGGAGARRHCRRGDACRACLPGVQDEASAAPRLMGRRG